MQENRHHDDLKDAAEHCDDYKDAVKYQDEQKTIGNRSYYEICGGARTAPEGPTTLHVRIYEAASANVIVNI